MALNYQHILSGLTFLNQHKHLYPENLTFDGRQWSVTKTKSANQANQLQSFILATIELINQHPQPQERNVLQNYLALFFHYQPNKLRDSLPLDQEAYLPYLRGELPLQKSTQVIAEIPKITKTDGFYTSPEDHLAFHHGMEAARIFRSTQWERIKSLIHSALEPLGIHVFEPTRYEELDYLKTSIYANDIAKPCQALNQPSYYWIGHASNLISIPSQTHCRPIHLLTDPVEGDLAPFVYPRMTKEGKLIQGTGSQKLPYVDVVIISHNHRDHVDEATLKRLVDQQPKMIVPEGDAALFKQLGFLNVVELVWGEQATLGDPEHPQLTITAVPARHWSNRGLFDAHRSAFNGYVIQAATLPQHDIYFAGDTAELGNDYAKAIYKTFNIGLAIQPGGPDEQRSDMESTHQSSADGITGHFRNILAIYEKTPSKWSSIQEFLNDIEPIKTIYDHTSTFKLGNLRLRDTFYSYARVVAAFKHQLNAQQVKTLLVEHEKVAYDNIRNLCDKMVINGQTLSQTDIASVIERDIIVPRIGQRFDLNLASTSERTHTSIPLLCLNDRDLILNRRALNQCDEIVRKKIALARTAVSLPTFIDELTYDLLRTYTELWHARLTRTNFDLFNRIMKRHDLSLTAKIEALQQHLTPQDKQGHLQNVLHYCRWIQNTMKEPQQLADYFIKLTIRQIVDAEVKLTGSWLIWASRSKKQELFEHLAYQLETPQTLNEYGAIFNRWYQANQSVLQENRSTFFSKPITHSTEVCDQIQRLLGAS